MTRLLLREWTRAWVEPGDLTYRPPHIWRSHPAVRPQGWNARMQGVADRMCVLYDRFAMLTMQGQVFGWYDGHPPPTRLEVPPGELPNANIQWRTNAVVYRGTERLGIEVDDPAHRQRPVEHRRILAGIFGLRTDGQLSQKLSVREIAELLRQRYEVAAADAPGYSDELVQEVLLSNSAVHTFAFMRLPGRRSEGVRIVVAFEELHDRGVPLETLRMEQRGALIRQHCGVAEDAPGYSDDTIQRVLVTAGLVEAKAARGQPRRLPGA
jgi:hypothetical protein